MSDLRTFCRKCGDEVPASACDHEGVCVVCVTAFVIGPLKAEYKRLWAKRAGYLKRGVSVRPVESQLATVARHLGDKVHARIGNAQLAIAILNAHLEDARNQVERGDSRIIRPKVGDLVRA